MKLTKLIISSLLLCLPVLASGQSESEGGAKDFRIRKGDIYTTLTFSLSTRAAENEDQIIRQVVKQDRYQFRVIANSGYAIQDNFTLGLSLGYGRQEEELTTLDDNNARVTSKKIEQGYSFAPVMRNYVPFGNGQLQIVVQTELGITIGETLQRTFLSDDVNKTEGDFVELGIGVSPGLVLFFDKHWAFETTVGLAGLSTRVEEKVTNDDEENRQRVVESTVDLRINLLQLNLGVAYYFN